MSCYSTMKLLAAANVGTRIPADYLSKSVDRLLRGCADKSLARPGRKQATAAKLGIYSTYSPRSSVHFLARCSNFYKQLKKNSEGCPSNQVSAAAITSASDEKWLTFNCFFSPGTGGSPTGPDPENRVGDQDTGSPDRPVSSGLQVPSEPGKCRARTRTLWWFPTAFLLQNVLQLHQQNEVILRVDSLALWKIINEEDAVLIPKNWGENFSSGILHSEFPGAGVVSRDAATPLIVALSPGHSDINSFRPWSPNATGNHLDRAEKIPKVAQTTGTVEVFDPRSSILGSTSLRASACPNLHEWWAKPIHVRCPLAQLLI